jgi:hypothetical protein
MGAPPRAHTEETFLCGMSQIGNHIGLHEPPLARHAHACYTLHVRYFPYVRQKPYDSEGIA